MPHFKQNLHPLEFQLLQKIKKVPQLFSEKSIWNLQISGGRDSMCLLSAFHNILNSPFFTEQKKTILVIVQHFNHQIRKEESQQEEQLVSKKSFEFGFDFYSENVELDSSKLNFNFQNEARKFRKTKAVTLCKTLVKKNHFEKYFIFTAHHARDHAESLLLHLIRGSSLEGLKGFSFLEKDFCKPFFDVSYADICTYAKDQKISFCEDSSNETIKYQRNRVRHLILPEIEKINPQYEKAFLRLSENIKNTFEKYPTEETKTTHNSQNQMHLSENFFIEKKVGNVEIKIHSQNIILKFPNQIIFDLPIGENYEEKIYHFLKSHPTLVKYLKSSYIHNLVYEIFLMLKEKNEY